MRDIYGGVAEIASRPPTICGGSYGAARHVAAEGRVAWLLDSAAWPGQLGLQFSPFRRTRHPRLRMSVMLPAYILHQHRRYAII